MEASKNGKMVENIFSIINDWLDEAVSKLLIAVQENKDIQTARAEYLAVVSLYNKLIKIQNGGKIANKELEKMMED